MRFAIDSCIFEYQNSTDPISTPCSTDTACGPLSEALENGNLDPTTESGYGYCSADENAFLGTFNQECVSCLQAGNTKILANCK